MKEKTIVFAAFLATAGIPPSAWGDECDPSVAKDTLCTLHVEEVRPAQFSVGSVAVDCKAEGIADKKKKKLEKYLENEKRQVPAVIGPDGNFYMTDHHHLSTALYRAESPHWGNKAKVLHIKVLDNYATKEPKVEWGEFWNDMQKLNRSYNFDNKGTPDMNFALLPTDVGGMLNDPYRTLSRWVRESCGYVKAGKEQCDAIRPEPKHEAPFFMEFYWGDFFRQHLPLEVADLEVCKSIPFSPTCLKNEVGQLKDIYDKAMELAASAEAKKYFEDRGLDPLAYGFNDTGTVLKLNFGGNQNACEDPVTE